MDFISNSIGAAPPAALRKLLSASPSSRGVRCTLTACFQVDFQLCNYASPVIDLHYFLSTSPQPKIFDEHRQFLLKEYWRTLTSSLAEYEYKGVAPSLEDLQRYFNERAVFAVIATFSALPLVTLEKSNAVDLDDMLKTDGTYHNPSFKGATFRKIMNKRVPYFDECGLLD